MKNNDLDYDIIRHENGSIEIILDTEIEKLKKELEDADFAYFHNRVTPDFKYITMYEALEDSTLELELFDIKSGIELYKVRIAHEGIRFMNLNTNESDKRMERLFAMCRKLGMNHAVHTKGFMCDDKDVWEMKLTSNDGDYLPFTELVFKRK